MGGWEPANTENVHVTRARRIKHNWSDMQHFSATHKRKPINIHNGFAICNWKYSRSRLQSCVQLVLRCIWVDFVMIKFFYKP